MKTRLLVTKATAAGDAAYITIMIKMINFRSKYIVTSAKP